MIDVKILNFGSLNIDYVYAVDHIVQEGETISSDAIEIHDGGKGLNQSIAMARAGAFVYHAGCVGEDGRRLLKTLKESGVDISNVHTISEDQTGNAVIQRDKNGNNCIILYPGANRRISESMIQETLQQFGEGDLLLLQNEINHMDHLIQCGKKQGMMIILNPSPLDDELRNSYLGDVDYFILNEIEAGQLLQKNVATGAMPSALLEKYPKAHFVLTLGEKGSVYYDAETFYRQKAFPTKVVDTTGAGDTFTGYFIVGLHEGLPIPEAMALASKAASLAVSRKGAAPSIPKREEVIL